MRPVQSESRILRYGVSLILSHKEYATLWGRPLQLAPPATLVFYPKVVYKSGGVSALKAWKAWKSPSPPTHISLSKSDREDHSRMRAARFYAKGDIRIEDVPEPTLSPGNVLVAVEWCGICGSDLHEYLAGKFGCQSLGQSFTEGVSRTVSCFSKTRRAAPSDRSEHTNDDGSRGLRQDQGGLCRFRFP